MKADPLRVADSAYFIRLLPVTQIFVYFTVFILLTVYYVRTKYKMIKNLLAKNLQAYKL